MRDPKGSGLADLLLFAEQLVVNDYFVVDALALNARLATIPRILEPFVQRREPATEVYEAAAASVRELSRTLWESSDESPALAQLLAEMTAEGPSEFWSGTDKRLHDYLDQSADSLRMVASAASTGGDTLSRALFYLEFGRHVRDVALLAPGKRRWLEIIGKALEQSLHEVIVKKFDGKVLAQLVADMPQAFGNTHLQPPPVAELILKRSIAEGLTLLEAAILIRDTPAAVDYRGMLSELRGQLRRVRSGMLEAQKALAGLDKIAEAWATTNDSRIGITRQHRTLSFEKVPLIGELLKAADMSKLEVLDLILDSPPGYLAFISSWYRDQPKP